MEKGYRDYGHDIDNTDGVLEAGLGFVDLGQARRFRRAPRDGRQEAAGPLARRLVQVLVTDPEPLRNHQEGGGTQTPKNRGGWEAAVRGYGEGLGGESGPSPPPSSPSTTRR